MLYSHNTTRVLHAHSDQTDKKRVISVVLTPLNLRPATSILQRYWILLCITTNATMTRLGVSVVFPPERKRIAPSNTQTEDGPCLCMTRKKKEEEPLKDSVSKLLLTQNVRDKPYKRIQSQGQVQGHQSEHELFNYMPCISLPPCQV